MSKKTKDTDWTVYSITVMTSVVQYVFVVKVMGEFVMHYKH